MTHIRSRALVALAAVLISAPVQGQVVGTVPEKSPFADLDDGHRIGIITGWLMTGRDPVGVGPHSGPLLGLRYDALIGSPAYFTGRIFGISATHDVYDPNKPNGQRKVGTASSNLLALDGGVSVALTGERTWHNFQPIVHGGVGMIAGVGNAEDVGGYKPDFTILFSMGLGARYSTGKNSEIRADLSWLYFKLRYPDSYRTTTAADNIPLRASGTLTPLLGHRGLTVSWTWGVFR